MHTLTKHSSQIVIDARVVIPLTFLLNHPVLHDIVLHSQLSPVSLPLFPPTHDDGSAAAVASFRGVGSGGVPVAQQDPGLEAAAGREKLK